MYTLLIMSILILIINFPYEYVLFLIDDLSYPLIAYFLLKIKVYEIRWRQELFVNGLKETN
jgi:hypothetical protein